MGITDFITNSSRKVSIFQIAGPQTYLKKGDKIFEATSGRKKIVFTSPVDGELKFINPAIKWNKILDPYGDDWIALIAPKNFIEDRLLLMSKHDYFNMLEREFISD